MNALFGRKVDFQKPSFGEENLADPEFVKKYAFIIRAQGGWPRVYSRSYAKAF